MSRSTFTSLSSSSGASEGPNQLLSRSAPVRITVPEATKIMDAHGKLHVVYTVQIRAPGLHRHVMKKFSEFRTFDTVWRSNPACRYPSVSVSLPQRVWLHSNKSERVIAERKAGLETYLNALAKVHAILPYIAQFLGVPVELLRPSSRILSTVPGTAATTGEHSDPNITRCRRRSAVAFSTIGSAISLTPKEHDLSGSSAPHYADPDTRSSWPPDSPSVKPMPAIRRTDAYQNVWTMAPGPPPPPRTSVDAVVDYQRVLLMALEAMLSPSVAPGPLEPGGEGGVGVDRESGASALLVEDDDLDGVLERDWDTGLVSTGADLVVPAVRIPRQLTSPPLPPPPMADLRL